MAAQRQSDDLVGDALTAIKDALNTGGCTCRLFRNDHTPAITDVTSDYTEANFSGYSPVSFTDFGSVTVSSHTGMVSASSIIFAHDGGGVANNIYGAYITRNSDGHWIIAQRDDAAPFAMDAGGKTYTVTPRMTYKSEFV